MGGRGGLIIGCILGFTADGPITEGAYKRQFTVYYLLTEQNVLHSLCFYTRMR